jgi:hypothetical protein
VKPKLVAALLIGVVLTVPAFAHHSTSMFNMAHPVTLTGVVKEFQWTNPHTHIVMEVKAADGKTEEWLVEIHSTAIMIRRGYSHSTFKPGDTITVTGGQMKDGSTMMRLLRGSFPDGRKFYGDDFAPGTDGTVPKEK